ncbi:hypothetical protein Micbo1qcDRAFT_179277 [Microdochium bolleyi]|uniref:Uncharacterized protein n=1 Tax=Microdochium bolleyi TaxID=196109 RepID=A0A136IQ29_9PEZI|nr:hypothetical protein Micbo1qcDRAFT_179277 [Microdochium bolleyi]
MCRIKPLECECGHIWRKGDPVPEKDDINWRAIPCDNHKPPQHYCTNFEVFGSNTEKLKHLCGYCFVHDDIMAWVRKLTDRLAGLVREKQYSRMAKIFDPFGSEKELLEAVMKQQEVFFELLEGKRIRSQRLQEWEGETGMFTFYKECTRLISEHLHDTSKGGKKRLKECLATLRGLQAGFLQPANHQQKDTMNMLSRIYPAKSPNIVLEDRCDVFFHVSV